MLVSAVQNSATMIVLVLRIRFFINRVDFCFDSYPKMSIDMSGVLSIVHISVVSATSYWHSFKPNRMKMFKCVFTLKDIFVDYV